MIRKLEKGEPLKVGDRIDIYGFSGTVTMIDDARPNYNYFNFCVEWPGCSAIRYCSADPFIERALLAPATITREEPGGKWTIQELEGILDPSGKPAITHDIVTALNDQAATIERLKKVIPKRELSSFAYPLETAESWGLEPVKEKKWEWVVRRSDIDVAGGIIEVNRLCKVVIYKSKQDREDAEKICRLLNEDDAVGGQP